jgi:hypothetical protein
MMNLSAAKYVHRGLAMHQAMRRPGEARGDPARSGIEIVDDNRFVVVRSLGGAELQRLRICEFKGYMTPVGRERPLAGERRV